MTQPKSVCQPTSPCECAPNYAHGKKYQQNESEREMRAFEYAPNNLTKNVHSHTQFTANKRFMTNQRHTHSSHFDSIRSVLKYTFCLRSDGFRLLSFLGLDLFMFANQIDKWTKILTSFPVYQRPNHENPLQMDCCRFSIELSAGMKEQLGLSR